MLKIAAVPSGLRARRRVTPFGTRVTAGPAGASGVAVQNFNRMFGFDERTALE